MYTRTRATSDVLTRNTSEDRAAYFTVTTSERLTTCGMVIIRHGWIAMGFGPGLRSYAKAVKTVVKSPNGRHPIATKGPRTELTKCDDKG